eukprot:sb/3469396/
MRSVSPEHLAMAYGIRNLLFRTVGTIPGPVAFGIIIDTACAVWQRGCDGSFGSCWEHDTTKDGEEIVKKCCFVQTQFFLSRGAGKQGRTRQKKCEKLVIHQFFTMCRASPTVPPSLPRLIYSVTGAFISVKLLSDVFLFLAWRLYNTSAYSTSTSSTTPSEEPQSEALDDLKELSPYVVKMTDDSELLEITYRERTTSSSSNSNKKRLSDVIRHGLESGKVFVAMTHETIV